MKIGVTIFILLLVLPNCIGMEVYPEIQITILIHQLVKLGFAKPKLFFYSSQDVKKPR